MKNSYEYKEKSIELYRKGRWPKEKYHSYKGEVGNVADSIINRDFSTTRPLEKWTTDVSQFNLPFGQCYSSSIFDMKDNGVIFYNISRSPNMEQWKDMLDKAFARFPSVECLILHPDQGWQYQHAAYCAELQKHGVIQSMSWKGNCYDNCIIEAFFGRFENKMFYGFEKEFTSFDIFLKKLRITSTTTTTLAFRLKQKGCLPQNSGKHP